MDARIVPVDPLNPEDADRFAEWISVHAVSTRLTFGADAPIWSADEVRSFYASPDQRRLTLAAMVDERVVGAAEVRLPVRDNTTSALLWLSVHPAWRRRRIGTRLLAAAEATAREEGRRLVRAQTEWATGAQDVFGEVFARPQGYAGVQTTLRSRLRLPLATGALEGLARDLAKRSADYDIETSWDGIPDDWLDDRAELARRMSTDIPLGDIVAEEEDWDADRVLADVEREAASGRRVLETAARHRPTGRLVGFTRLAVSATVPRLAYQHDTLVTHEHRGHGLGLRIKVANLQALEGEVPDASAVLTWNAEENEHMLAVNRRLGFQFEGSERTWQKTLGAVSQRGEAAPAGHGRWHDTSGTGTRKAAHGIPLA